MRLFHKKQPSETVPVLSEEEKRMHRCCFTGHRPEKLIRSEIEIKAALREEIKQAICPRFRDVPHSDGRRG